MCNSNISGKINNNRMLDLRNSNMDHDSCATFVDSGMLLHILYRAMLELRMQAL